MTYNFVILRNEGSLSDSVAPSCLTQTPYRGDASCLSMTEVGVGNAAAPSTERFLDSACGLRSG